MIRAENICYAIAGQPILRGIDLEIRDDEMLAIVGPNGCGKTTLLRTLYGSNKPDSGEIFVNGDNVRKLSSKALARMIAVVVQENVSDIPTTVADLVMLGRLPYQGMMGSSREGDEEIVAEVLERVGMLDKAKRDFAQLSGGERQRATIARALAQQADHLLLDEPTNHLDIMYQHEVLGMVAESEGSSTVVLHDLNLAATYCDRVVVMESGRIVADGDPEHVLTPEILEPVYGVRVQRFDHGGTVHLHFERKAR